MLNFISWDFTREHGDLTFGEHGDLTFGEHGDLTFGEHGDLTRENADLTSNYRENGDLIRDFIGWNGDAAW